jgi:homoserine dehydrogenase
MFSSTQISEKIAVIKFGSSVLPDISSIPNAVHEVYQYLRIGYKVLVIVSAIGNATNDLIATSSQVFDDPYSIPPSHAFAELLATGETAAASIFTISLHRIGIPALKLDHSYLQTKGSYVDAEPYIFQTARILNLFEKACVLVLPGFVGINQEGSLTLLGRGGSDFSAIFAAWSLKAAICAIYKDTDGIFNIDPGITTTALPYRTITYADCLRIPYPVIQHKAIKFARTKHYTFTVKSLSSTQGTRVGAEKSLLGQTRRTHRFKVILFGLGTVGLGVYHYLLDNTDLFEIVGIGVKDLSKHRYLQISEAIISDNLQEIITRDCDVIIELIGGIEASEQLVTQALLQKRHVITANKALIAAKGQYLSHLAVCYNAKLLYSATVAGSIPILEILRLFNTANVRSKIQSITGILNGTSNFILDKIREGQSLIEAIKSAQKAGFSEADPSLDLNGTDAAQKLQILARHAFNQELSNITVEGIQNIKEDFVRRDDQKNIVRLVACCELKNGALEASVKPNVLADSHPLAHVVDANNCILIQTVIGEVITLHGKGAGRWPTAEAVYADLLHLVLNCQAEDTSTDQHDSVHASLQI